MNRSNKAFVDMCIFIANYHPASKRNDFENDVCIKSGLTSFKDSMEYRDRYLTISSAFDDNAAFVEYLEPVQKVVVLIDGRGTVGTLDSDYQYLIDYITQLYIKVDKFVKEQSDKEK